MGRHSSRALWTAKLLGKPVPGGPRAAKVWPEGMGPKSGAAFQGIVLGIDPSLRGTGLALVEFIRGEARLLCSQTVKMKKEATMAACLAEIFHAVEGMLKCARVTHVALEQPIFVQNNRIAMIMGAARGVAMVAAARQGLPVFEYPPKRIKQAVVGFGSAQKEQLARTMALHLRLAQALPYDEADAAAVALCHAFTWRGEV